MNEQKLIATAHELMADPKGLLAMDESNPTCDKRFAKLGIPQTADYRRAYREMIVDAPGLSESMMRQSAKPRGTALRSPKHWLPKASFPGLK